MGSFRLNYLGKFSAFGPKIERVHQATCGLGGAPEIWGGGLEKETGESLSVTKVAFLRVKITRDITVKSR